LPSKADVGLGASAPTGIANAKPANVKSIFAPPMREEDDARGGLDTSMIRRWLQKTCRCEIVTFTADPGPDRMKAKATSRLRKKSAFAENCPEVSSKPEIRSS